jgi:hypothetical protein
MTHDGKIASTKHDGEEYLFIVLDHRGNMVHEGSRETQRQAEIAAETWIRNMRK